MARAQHTRVVLLMLVKHGQYAHACIHPAVQAVHLFGTSWCTHCPACCIMVHAYSCMVYNKCRQSSVHIKVYSCVSGGLATAEAAALLVPRGSLAAFYTDGTSHCPCLSTCTCLFDCLFVRLFVRLFVCVSVCCMHVASCSGLPLAFAHAAQRH